MSNINSLFNNHSLSSLFNPFSFQPHQALIPDWRRISSLPVQDFSVPKSSYFLFGSGPTIDPGNTLGDRDFDKLVVFGDSLSDIGNLSKELKAVGVVSPPFPPPPFAQTGSIGKDGRLTNGDLTKLGLPGDLWVEYFAPRVGLQNKLEDFAFIGSTSGRVNVARTTAPNLPAELYLPGVLDQVDSFVANPGTCNQKADPTALYVLWGGANDFLTLFPVPSISSAIKAALDGVANVAHAITTLANDGAETIVVPNVPNLGRTPFADGQNSAKADLVGVATVFSVGFNLLLQPTLVALERQLKKVDPKVDIVQVDAFSLSEDIARHPEKFGFKNTTDPLFGQPIDVQLANPDKFVFADPFHPTTRTHEVFADLFEQSLSRPVASNVFETSALVIKDLIHSSGGQAAISELLGLAQSSPLLSQGGLLSQALGSLLSSNNPLAAIAA